MLTIGSLFTGGGGLDMAVKMLWPDARIAWTSEFDKAASRLLAARYLLSPNHGDITAIDWTSVEPVDVLVGGFPCQDISHAGKRAGITEETRSGLWFHFRDAIRTLAPRLVLVENVAAIASSGGGMDVVLGSLAEIGFDAEWGLLRASDVGACHQRARWFCVAWPADTDLPRLEGRHGQGVRERRGERPAGPSGPPAGLTLLPTPAVNDMGEGKSVEQWDAWTADMKARHGNGNGHGKSLAIEAARHAGRWGEYEPAIRRHEAVFGRPAPEPLVNGSINPAFSEWMMGWPEGWVDLDGLSRRHRLTIIGNGVVPAQAAHAFGQLLARVAAHQTAAA